MKFTRQEVLEQSERTMKTGESTPVFEAWKKIALGWIVDDEKGLYLQKGFVGWDNAEIINSTKI